MAGPARVRVRYFQYRPFYTQHEHDPREDAINVAIRCACDPAAYT